MGGEGPGSDEAGNMDKGAGCAEGTRERQREY